MTLLLQAEQATMRWLKKYHLKTMHYHNCNPVTKHLIEAPTKLVKFCLWVFLRRTGKQKKRARRWLLFVVSTGWVVTLCAMLADASDECLTFLVRLNDNEITDASLTAVPTIISDHAGNTSRSPKHKKQTTKQQNKPGGEGRGGENPAREREKGPGVGPGVPGAAAEPWALQSQTPKSR